MSEMATSLKSKWYRIDTPTMTYWSPQPKLADAYYEIDLIEPDDDSYNAKRRAKRQELINTRTKYPTGKTLLDNTLVLVDDAEILSKEENPPPGRYRYEYDQYHGTDKLFPITPRGEGETPVVMSGKIFNELRNDLKLFLSSRQIYQDAGTSYRYGALCYGPPGNGKSTLIRQLIAENTTFQGSLQISCSMVPTPNALAAFEQLQPLKLFIFEELSTSVQQFGETARLLDFLDGDTSVSNSVTIATTNYPESLPGNIVDRPSRFDQIYRFGPPTAPERRALLDKILGRSATIEDVSVTDGMSLAYVREAALRSRIRGLTVSQVTKVLKDRMKTVKSDFQEASKISMGLNSSDDDEPMDFEMWKIDEEGATILVPMKETSE